MYLQLSGVIDVLNMEHLDKPAASPTPANMDIEKKGKKSQSQSCSYAALSRCPSSAMSMTSIGHATA